MLILRSCYGAPTFSTEVSPEDLRSISEGGTKAVRPQVGQEPNSEQVTIVAKHRLPHQGDRRTTEGKEFIVKTLPGHTAAAIGAPFVSKLAYHQLTHGVVQVSGIESAPGRLLPGRSRVL